MPDFTIGGAAVTPADSSYTDQPDAKFSMGGELPDGCHWTLEISVATATMPVKDSRCVSHFYRVRTLLTQTCPADIKTAGETRVTRTGPHCPEEGAAAPEPKGDTAFKGSKTPDKGTEEVSLELPDGTKVTLTLPKGQLPGVKLDYPSGTPTTLPAPQA